MCLFDLILFPTFFLDFPEFEGAGGKKSFQKKVKQEKK